MSILSVRGLIPATFSLVKTGQGFRVSGLFSGGLRRLKFGNVVLPRRRCGASRGLSVVDHDPVERDPVDRSHLPATPRARQHWF